jgi:hypothetical protein
VDHAAHRVLVGAACRDPTAVPDRLGPCPLPLAAGPVGMRTIQTSQKTGAENDFARTRPRPSLRHRHRCRDPPRATWTATTVARRNAALAALLPGSQPDLHRSRAFM